MISSDHLDPEEEGQIKATVSTEGKKGLLSKTIQVRSNDPEHPLVILKLKALVKDPFHESFTKADEIFRTPCRKCHVDRGTGRKGAKLFRADCLMCHRRGKAAPSLSRLRKIREDKLKTSIEFGKRGSLMPGFSSSVGGPLTDTEIRSLIRYIKRR